MSSARSHLEILVRKHFHQQATPEEEARLMEMLAEGRYNREIRSIMDSLWPEVSRAYTLPQKERDALFSLILDKTEETYVPPNTRSGVRRLWLRYAAAILVIIAGVALYYFNGSHGSAPAPSGVLAVQPEVWEPQAGRQAAVLTLSDGRHVMLGDTVSTILDGSLQIRNHEGKLAYAHTDRMVYNTMSTPKGGEYQLELPDGTRVWLNAASSIRFPTAFLDSVREVELSGEAYFEVAHDPQHPFVIRTYKEDVTVLGTILNVNCYEDEPHMKTTLVEGAALVGQDRLRPGQAWLDGKVVPTDVRQDIAWKNGAFSFRNADLKAVMRQLARWYNIEVVYEGEIPAMRFDGEIGRNLSLQEVLDGLTESRLKYRMQGSTIIIHP